jgi:hypothetical protein
MNHVIGATEGAFDHDLLMLRQSQRFCQEPLAGLAQKIVLGHDNLLRVLPGSFECEQDKQCVCQCFLFFDSCVFVEDFSSTLYHCFFRL